MIFSEAKVQEYKNNGGCLLKNSYTLFYYIAGNYFFD
jgi:hypothetical protein